MRRLLIAVAAAALLAAAVTPAVAVSTSPRLGNVVGPERVDRDARFESSATLSPQPDNPFDPGQADVWGHFVDPTGHEWQMPAFWYQGYTRALVDGHEVLTAAGAPSWRVRFTPTMAGTWRWWWTARTPAGIDSTMPRRLAVADRADRGFVHASPSDNRYLAFDDGSPYFAVGENVGWYDQRGTFAYDDWYGHLAAEGATYARLWMPSWAFGLEWSDTGLGDYRRRLDRAWQLDQVIDTGERLGIRQVISLQNHGPFSETANSEWAANPYNAANGGPLTAPGQVFTDRTAIELFKRRFRYVVARWGYSTAVLGWELWNEADFVTPYVPAASLAWHQEMAAYLRSLDPYRHLVSTSFAIGPGDVTVWSQAALDYTQMHFYSGGSGGPPLFPDLAADAATWMPATHAAYQRPTLMGELGVDSRGPTETMAADPAGIGVHDGLWGGALADTFGTAMPWWWDNVIAAQPDRYYPMFGSISRFVAGVDWGHAALHHTTSTAASPTRRVVLYGVQGPETALLWVKNDAHQWTAPDWDPVSDATITLTGLSPGRWWGGWWDTWAGQVATTFTLTAGPVPTTVAAPPFAGDVALRLTACNGA